MNSNTRYAAAAAVVCTGIIIGVSAIAAHEGLYVRREGRTVYGWDAFWGVAIPGGLAMAFLALFGGLAVWIIRGGRR